MIKLCLFVWWIVLISHFHQIILLDFLVALLFGVLTSVLFYKM
jgi:hypothetical protein